ncbi:hypothetical protein KTAU_43610 [Thermogemmatispora aurantia]|uniref:Uncharacterized protein n=1 Tax=Thermogemmatispora aurantia TaxID=2045279 RepID=A0A5J4KH13_9CHLR|nr:hypothetical protein KTAU_43610 [Thermogemmatispora aurantia]
MVDKSLTPRGWLNYGLAGRSCGIAGTGAEGLVWVRDGGIGSGKGQVKRMGGDERESQGGGDEMGKGRRRREAGCKKA